MQVKRPYLAIIPFLLLLSGDISHLSFILPVNYINAQGLEGTWTQVFPSPSPGPRRSSAWALDTIHNVIVLFGGTPASGETWVYDLVTKTWTQKFPAVSPPSRSVHAMTFDSNNGVAVLFGGYRTGHATELNDTWVYDYSSNNWTQVNTPVAPPVRHWPGLEFDKITGKVVLFGGHNPASSDITQEDYNDTWLLDVATSTWTQVFPTQSPSPRHTHLLYNNETGLIYMFGGKYEVDIGGPNHQVVLTNDLWSYNASTNTWTVLQGNSTSPTVPEARRTKLAFDSVNDVAVMSGGDGAWDPLTSWWKLFTDTWVYHFDTNTWEKITAATSPPARYRHLVIYDPINQRTVAYGGTDKPPATFGDVWEFNLTQHQTIMIDAGPDQTGLEGSQFSFSGSYTDPGNLVNPTATWNFGDGTTAQGALPAALTQTHVYADNGVYTVTLTITDETGSAGSDTLVATVNNASPIVDAGPDVIDNQGVVTIQGSFTDSGTADIHTGSINWGDGTSSSGAITEASGSGTVSATHTYGQNGAFTITATVTDDESSSGVDTLNASVTSAVTGPLFTPTSLTVSPSARELHTAVWDGSEMIIWGGASGSVYTNTGAKYNPTTDTWISISITGAPAARKYHTGIWTGSQMIVWGGFSNGPTYHNTGGRYDPSTNTWASITTTNAPVGRERHTAVWTGTEMIIWGGNTASGLTNTGAKYNPSTNTWTAINTTNAPSARERHTAVWTGAEMIIWGGSTTSGKTNTGARYNPTTDTWTPITLTGAPTGRDFHTAIWSGNQMIIWGGNTASGRTITGAKYSPSTDTWTPTGTTGAPSARDAHTAVWSGNEMIVWSGFSGTSRTNTGGRYNPGADTWIATPTTDAPAGRIRHSAVWTGTQMIVWGGLTAATTSTNTGGRLSNVSPNNPPANNLPVANNQNISTDEDMPLVITLTGSDADGNSLTFSIVSIPTSGTLSGTPPNVTYTPNLNFHGADSFTFKVNDGTVDSNIATVSITVNSVNDVPIANAGPNQTVREEAQVTLNGSGSFDSDNDPLTYAWTQTAGTPMTLSNANAVNPTFTSPTVSTQEQLTFELVVNDGASSSTPDTIDIMVKKVEFNTQPVANAGPDQTLDEKLQVTLNGSGSSDSDNDPLTYAWTQTVGPAVILSNANAVSPTFTAPSVSTQVTLTFRLIVNDGIVDSAPDDVSITVNDMPPFFSPTNTIGAPSARERHTAVWTGTEMIIWGGASGTTYFKTGAKYNPSTDTWIPTSTINAPEARKFHTAIWTGTEMIIWGGKLLNTGGRYNQSTDTWTSISTVNAPTGRNYHTAVWTGTEMIIWGGNTASGKTNTGAKYDPSTDTWTSISTVNAPAARQYHTAIWTGTEMIIWGGSTTSGKTNTGARYNPTTDTWTSISTVGALSGRELHTAVWTGTEMIIWGGNTASGKTNTGAKYNPSTSTWIPITITGAPSARNAHSGIWSGNEMVIWSGFAGSARTDTGGRYNPTTDIWIATPTTDAPAGRTSHTSVWTGSQMITWGGLATTTTTTSTGGRLQNLV